MGRTGGRWVAVANVGWQEGGPSVPEWVCPRPAVPDGGVLWEPQGRGVSRTPLWGSRAVQMVVGEGNQGMLLSAGPQPWGHGGDRQAEVVGATESGGGPSPGPHPWVDGGRT